MNAADTSDNKDSKTEWSELRKELQYDVVVVRSE